LDTKKAILKLLNQQSHILDEIKPLLQSYDALVKHVGIFNKSFENIDRDSLNTKSIENILDQQKRLLQYVSQETQKLFKGSHIDPKVYIAKYDSYDWDKELAEYEGYFNAIQNLIDKYLKDANAKKEAYELKNEELRKKHKLSEDANRRQQTMLFLSLF
jgi:hypothetical protein